MMEMLRTLLADLGEVGQVIAKNQDPKKPEQGKGKIEGEFNRIVEKYQAKMGAMTDPDHADEETKAEHQEDGKKGKTKVHDTKEANADTPDEDTNGKNAKGQGKKPAEDHTKAGAAANPNRAKKKMEAEHQGDDGEGKTKVHNTKKANDKETKAEHQENNTTGKTEVHNTAGGEKGTEKKGYREQDEARGTDGHGRDPHYPREARLRHVLGAAIRICKEEDEAGKGPGKEGGGQTEGNK